MRPGGAERMPPYPEWMIPSTAWKPSMRPRLLRGSAASAAASAGSMRCLGQGVAADEAVHSIAGVIGVQGDDAVEGLALQLRLEELDFGLLCNRSRSGG